MGALSSIQRVPLALDHRPTTSPEVSILILGTAASGKTTLFRQLRTSGNCTPLERRYYSKILLYNLWEVFKAMSNACAEFNIDLSYFKKHFDQITEKWYNVAVTPEVLNALRALGDEPQLWDSLRQSQSISVAQTVRFFLKNVDRFTTEGFVPDDDDILNSYAATVGIDHTSFKTPLASISVTDIGGSEFARRKWKDFYSNLSLLIFVVDLARFGKQTTAGRLPTVVEEESVVVVSEPIRQSHA